MTSPSGIWHMQAKDLVEIAEMLDQRFCGHRVMLTVSQHDERDKVEKGLRILGVQLAPLDPEQIDIVLVNHNQEVDDDAEGDMKVEPQIISFHVNSPHYSDNPLVGIYGQNVVITVYSGPDRGKLFTFTTE